MGYVPTFFEPCVSIPIRASDNGGSSLGRLATCPEQTTKGPASPGLDFAPSRCDDRLFGNGSRRCWCTPDIAEMVVASNPALLLRNRGMQCDGECCTA